MPKNYKDMIDEIINKMEEDAPVNSVADGVVDMAPNPVVAQSPKMLKRKKEQGDVAKMIAKKIGQMVKSNEDNNSVLLKQVLDGLDKVDTRIDEQIYGKTITKRVKNWAGKQFLAVFPGWL